MKKSKKVKKAKKVKDPVAASLREWLDSDEGKARWAEAQERARELHKKLEKAFQLTYEQLHRRLD